jgi:hypothetical protein
MTRLQIVATKSPGVSLTGESTRIVDAVFYGDNGKCALSSMDGGTGTERRQALALLVETSGSGNDAMLELWLVRYDACSFVPLPICGGEIEARSGIVGQGDSNSEESASDAPFIQVVKPLPQGYGYESSIYPDFQKRSVLFARTRSIAPVSTYSSVRLVVSGSRGVGAVVTSHPSLGSAVIDLYDLEDDEEEDEEFCGINEEDDSDSGSMSTDY